MKFFLDSANLQEVEQAASWGVIDGVTTNPSLIAREGIAVEEQIRKICSLVDGDVSASVISTSTRDIIAEGRRLSQIHRNVIVKIAITEPGIAAIAELAKEGIRTNATLCFSASQALIAAKAGAYLVSAFLGRVDDIGSSGTQLIEDIIRIYSNYAFKTQVLAASIRGQQHLTQAAKAGAHVATLPFKLLQSLFHHPLTEKGLNQFLEDHNKTFELIKV